MLWCKLTTLSFETHFDDFTLILPHPSQQRKRLTSIVKGNQLFKCGPSLMNNAVPQVKSLGSALLAHLLRARSWGKQPDSNPFKFPFLIITESPVTVWPEWR